MPHWNPYVWDLYAASEAGQLALDHLSGLSEYATRRSLLLSGMGLAQKEWALSETGAFLDSPMTADEVAFIRAVLECARALPAVDLSAAQRLLTVLVQGNQVFGSDHRPITLDDAYVALPALSLGLHLAHPEVFLPLNYEGIYFLFIRIAETFDIPLPPVPAKNDPLARWLYYASVCSALHDFRRRHGLSVTELLAFLYGFAPEYLFSLPEADLPEPRYAWLLLGSGSKTDDYGWLEETDETSSGRWQGNLDMRRGDVCVMYVRSPVSATHSIWRVTEDAYEDPFFHYKHAVQIGHPVRVPAVHFRDLAAHPVLGTNRYVRANLQGASGKALSHHEYHQLLEMMRDKGDLPEGIPTFPKTATVDLTALANERDVETQLVEPLLYRLGLTSPDWLRQLPVRMGRGERVYPDYAIGVSGKAPEQRVRALLEVKYRAAGERDWREAFLQAKSYGLRLGARTIVTAAAEGVRIYLRGNYDFDDSRFTGFGWSDLQEGEHLRWLRRVLNP